MEYMSLATIRRCTILFANECRVLKNKLDIVLRYKKQSRVCMILLMYAIT